MYTGNVAPTGFVMCDNSQAAINAGAPDLRDKFIVGAGNPAAPSALYSLGSQGGTNSHTLSWGNIPEHYHHAFGAQYGGWIRYGSNLNANNYAGFGTWTGGGWEAYNISAVGTESNVGRTSRVGSNPVTPIDNRPVYFALCYIMKT